MNLIHDVVMQKSTWRVWVLLIDLTCFSCFGMECMLKVEVTVMVISWLYHGGYSAKIENDGGGILNDCCDEL